MTKTWKHHKKFNSFSEADREKNDLKKTNGLWVKIRKRPDATFDVVTWKDKETKENKHE